MDSNEFDQALANTRDTLRPQMVEVRYHCPCLQGTIPVRVRARRGWEPLGHWIELVVIQAVGRDHLTRSPQCTRGKVDLRIPVPKGGGVGTADSTPHPSRPELIFKPRVEEIDG